MSSKHRSKFTAIHGQSWRLNWYVLSGMGKKSINQLFYGPLENIWLISRRHHCRWRGCKFRTVLGTQGLWAWRDLFGATPAVTRGLGFSSIIRMTTPFNHLLLLVKGWKIKAYAEHSGPLSIEGSLLCHICCDTGPQFSESRPMDRPIQSPLTTCKGGAGEIF